ncbi:MAG: nucleotide exchange factor GrpE [Firmicutes bacterium]|nr:nucleotide exchange factor GrpE [Bacillota bacterium]
MTNNEDMNKQEVPEEELPETEDQAAEDAEQTAGTEGASEEKPADEAKEAAAQEAESERYSRLFAEFQNYKRRTEKEKSDLYAYAGEKFAKGLLDVIDNFERAMDAKPEGDKFADGMELILVQLKGVLEKNKVEEIKALGEPFDPNFHNAVMTEAVEGTESGIVTRVMQKGYTLNGKVIRPAMVAVSQ